MSDQDYGVLLHDANDVLPQGLVGTPWEIIFNALRDVLKSGVGASDSDFLRKACALYFLARGDLDAVTDPGVLNGIAAALAIPFWVENFNDPKQASAIIYHWIKYLPTRANLTALALASGMRAFKLREIYTSTEYGLSHTFGFDLGEGYDTSFFAGPNAEPGLATAQRICGALTHFFLRIKDAPTLITDITYPSASPSGWQYFFRSDQSEIRILQGYNWDLYDADGNLAMLPDEYAVVEPVAVRDTYGTNTAISGSTHLITLDDGQMRISWGQSPVNAYALFANVSINIPDMFQAWPSLDHVDVNIPPNAIPGSPLFDGMGDRVFGEGWSIFAAYDSNLNRIDIDDLYLVGGSDLYDPVYLRARRYLTVCSVWLSYTEPPPPPFDEDSIYILVNETTGEIVYSISETEENPSMVFSQVGHIEMPDSEMITIYETGVPVQSFYFTTNGRNETQNTDISHADIPVYFEDGTSPAADTPYDGSSVLAFMDVTGNTKQANGESLYLDDGVLRLDAPDTDEGEQWAALVEKVFPDILTLWAKITDNSEKMYLQTRVINTSTPNSTYLYALYTDEALTQRFVIDSNKIYELGAFRGQNFAPYDIQDVSQMPSTTVSGTGAVSGFLLVDQSGAYLWAATNHTYSTYVNAPGNKLSFKCRVGEPPSITAYFTNQGAAATGDITISNSGWDLPLYDATGNYIPWVDGLPTGYLKPVKYSGEDAYGDIYLRKVNNLIYFRANGNSDVYKVIIPLA